MEEIKPRLWTREYLLLLLSNCLLTLSFGCFLPVVPLFVVEIGGSIAFAGTIAGALTMAMMLSRPLCGMAMDRYGRLPIILCGGALFVVNCVAYLFVENLFLLLALRVAHGASTCFFATATGTLIADIVPRSRLMNGIGYYRVTASLFAAIGPFTGAYVSARYGFSRMFALMAVTAACGTVLPVFIGRVTTPTPPREPEKRTVSRLPLEVSALLPAAISSLLFMGQSAVSNFLPACGAARGIEQISLFFLVYGGALVLVRFFSERILEGLGRTAAVAMGAGGLAVGYLLLAAARSEAPVLAAGVLCGLGEGIVSPMLNVLVFERSPPHRRGTANATYGVLNDVGNGLGAALWGVTSDRVGFAVTYLGATGCALASLLLYCTALRPRLRGRR